MRETKIWELNMVNEITDLPEAEVGSQDFGTQPGSFSGE